MKNSCDVSGQADLHAVDTAPANIVLSRMDHDMDHGIRYAISVDMPGCTESVACAAIHEPDTDAPRLENVQASTSHGSPLGPVGRETADSTQLSSTHGAPVEGNSAVDVSSEHIVEASTPPDCTQLVSTDELNTQRANAYPGNNSTQLDDTHNSNTQLDDASNSNMQLDSSDNSNSQLASSEIRDSQLVHSPSNGIHEIQQPNRSHHVGAGLDIEFLGAAEQEHDKSVEIIGLDSSNTESDVEVVSQGRHRWAQLEFPAQQNMVHVGDGNPRCVIPIDAPTMSMTANTHTAHSNHSPQAWYSGILASSTNVRNGTKSHSHARTIDLCDSASQSHWAGTSSDRRQEHRAVVAMQSLIFQSTKGKSLGFTLDVASEKPLPQDSFTIKCRYWPTGVHESTIHQLFADDVTCAQSQEFTRSLGHIASSIFNSVSPGDSKLSTQEPSGSSRSMLTIFFQMVERCMVRRYTSWLDSEVKMPSDPIAICGALDAYSVPKLPSRFAPFNSIYTGEHNSLLWAHKYRPLNTSEICGNRAAVNKIRSWLDDWKQTTSIRAGDMAEGEPTHTAVSVAELASSSETDDSGPCTAASRRRMNAVQPMNSATKPLPKRRRRGSHDSCGSSDSQTSAGTASSSRDTLCNCLMLYGPTGAGKTATIYAAAAECGFTVIEINAGMMRHRKAVDDLIGEATKSKRVHMGADMAKTSPKDTSPMQTNSITSMFTKQKTSIASGADSLVPPEDTCSGKKRGRSSKSEVIPKTVEAAPAKKHRTLFDMFGGSKKSSDPIVARAEDAPVVIMDDTYQDIADGCGATSSLNVCNDCFQYCKGQAESGEHCFCFPDVAGIIAAASKSNKNTMILIEDVDVHFGAVSASATADDLLDKGFATALRDLLEDAKCPIVLVGSALPSNVPGVTADVSVAIASSPLASSRMLLVPFPRPNMPELTATIAAVAVAEDVTEYLGGPSGTAGDFVSALRQLIVNCDRDVRQCLNQLQFHTQRLPATHSSSLSSIKQHLSQNMHDSVDKAAGALTQHIAGAVAACHALIAAPALDRIQPIPKPADTPGIGAFLVPNPLMVQSSCLEVYRMSIDSELLDPLLRVRSSPAEWSHTPVAQKPDGRKAANTGVRHGKRAKPCVDDEVMEVTATTDIQHHAELFLTDTHEGRVYIFAPPHISLSQVAAEPHVVVFSLTSPTEQSTVEPPSAPLVHAVDPPTLFPRPSAMDAEARNLTIIGENFVPQGLRVTIGGVVCEICEFIDSTTIRARIPHASILEWTQPGVATDDGQDSSSWVRCNPIPQTRRSTKGKPLASSPGAADQIVESNPDFPPTDAADVPDEPDLDTSVGPNAEQVEVADTSSKLASSGCTSVALEAKDRQAITFLDVEVISVHSREVYNPHKHNRLLLATSCQPDACNGDPASLLSRRPATLKGYMQPLASFDEGAAAAVDTDSPPASTTCVSPTCLPVDHDIGHIADLLESFSLADTISVPRAQLSGSKYIVSNVAPSWPVPCFPICGVTPSLDSYCADTPTFIAHLKTGLESAESMLATSLATTTLGTANVDIGPTSQLVVPDTHNTLWFRRRAVRCPTVHSLFDAIEQQCHYRGSLSYDSTEGERTSPDSVSFSRVSALNRSSSEVMAAADDPAFTSYLETVEHASEQRSAADRATLEMGIIDQALRVAAVSDDFFLQGLDLVAAAYRSRTALSYAFTMFMRTTDALALVPQGSRALLLPHGYAPCTRSCQFSNSSNLDVLAALRSMVSSEERRFIAHHQQQAADVDDDEFRGVRTRRRRAPKAPAPFASYLVYNLGLAPETLAAYDSLWKPMSLRGLG